MKATDIIDESNLIKDQPADGQPAYDPATQGAFPKYFAKLNKDDLKNNFMVKWDLDSSSKNKEMGITDAIDSISELASSEIVSLFAGDDKTSQIHPIKNINDKQRNELKIGVKYFDNFSDLKKKLDKEIPRSDNNAPSDENAPKDIALSIKRSNYVSKTTGFYDVLVASEIIGNSDIGFHNLGVTGTGTDEKIVTFDFGKGLNFYMQNEYQSIFTDINSNGLRGEIHAEMLLKEEFAASLDRAANKSSKEVKEAIDQSLNKIRSHYKNCDPPQTLGIDGSLLLHGKLQGQDMMMEDKERYSSFNAKTLDEQIESIKSCYIEKISTRQQECKDLATSVRFQIAVKDKNIDQAINIIDQNPELFKNGGPHLIHDKKFSSAHDLGYNVEKARENNPELKMLVSEELFDGYTSKEDLKLQRKIEAKIERVKNPPVIDKVKNFINSMDLMGRMSAKKQEKKEEIPSTNTSFTPKRTPKNLNSMDLMGNMNAERQGKKEEIPSTNTSFTPKNPAAKMKDALINKGGYDNAPKAPCMTEKSVIKTEQISL